MDELELDRAQRRRSRRRRALLALLLGASMATLGAGAMSLAIFTDSEASNGTWTAGTVILGVSPSTAFNATGIMPGDSGSQTVVVANNGTGDLRYSMSTSATNADGKGLAGQLDLTIRAGTCAAPGTTLYSGKVDVAALGSGVQGPQAGDRTVTAPGSDSLCFSWSFPFGSDNAFQAATTTATFTFAAEQTANNP
jgi:spore coat-associated protein N